MEDISYNYDLSNRHIRPIAIVSQLLQLVTSMHHIDELFAWITSILVQRFGVVSAQLWANQANSKGGVRCKLRASASQNPFQALQTFEGIEMRTFIERIVREQRGILSIPVTSIFSQYQAAALVQQNCQYWTICFFNKDVFLPSPQRHPEKDEVPTPLQMVFSLFTQQPLQSSQARAISFLIEQSLRIAISHGLLSKTAEKSQAAIQSTFASLIPERIQTTEVEQAENPFNSAIVIPEKRNRQVYNLIDGKKNIEELTLLVRVSRKEILEILQSLLAKGYIKVREVGGNSREVSSFFQLM